MHPYRTHTCGELRSEHAGKTVRLSGFVHRKRDHGGLLFIDLRDDSGITQCVSTPESSHFPTLERLRVESVLCITGQVTARNTDAINPKMTTGEVELMIQELSILSEAEELPLPVFAEPDYPEEIRLRYRYLDLRRQRLHQNIHLRSQIIEQIRQLMNQQGFPELQTPVLTASSPEGARDFLVPSRLHPGQFYALPQAPQQFKQLLMASGFDRYFQIAPCFRDEDARADRSPGEFYQLDIEMSFATQEDVFAVIEPLLHRIFCKFADGRSVSDIPFPRLTYAESMLKYGCDKPDLRNPLLCCDLSDVFGRPDMGFKAFASLVAKGGIVRGIPAPGAASRPRSFFDKLNEWARKEMQAPGLGYVLLEQGENSLEGKGPIAKFLQPGHIDEIARRACLNAGDAIFFSAGKKSDAEKLAAAARDRIGTELGLTEQNVFRFCWIVDYPLYQRDEQNRQIIFSHNPFSMPQGGMKTLKAAKTDDEKLAILAWQYDIVCNGIELSSGAIRNHRPDIMLKAFELAGHSPDSVERQFAGIISAFRHGTPPHGGIAPGIDRIVMLLAGADNIRDVICFPMNQQAQDLMMGAPSTISPEQLRELHIRTIE